MFPFLVGGNNGYHLWPVPPNGHEQYHCQPCPLWLPKQEFQVSLILPGNLRMNMNVFNHTVGIKHTHCIEYLPELSLRAKVTIFLSFLIVLSASLEKIFLGKIV